MALFSISNVKITGISTCVPKNKALNKDYSWIDKKEREMLIKTTGVETRRIVAGNESTSDLCYIATKRLLKDIKWGRDEIDVLILVTQSPDYLIPASAIILQDRLGFSKKCLAFDINLGCSGYVYGLSVITGIMSSAKLKKGLLLVGDVSSRGISDRDKSAKPLFSDAGTATALEYDESCEPMHFNLMSDGEGYEAIIIPDGGMRNPFTKKSLEYKEYEPGVIRNRKQIVLNGIDIFNFTLREVAPNLKELLAHLDKTMDEIDYFVFHQANLLMNEAVRKKLKLSKEKVPYSLREYGNTSSATIPLTIVTELRDVIRSKKLSLVFSGFGVGFSWGAVMLKTEKVTCPEITEME